MRGYLYSRKCRHVTWMGTGLSILFFMGACSSAEYIAPKRFYSIDKVEEEKDNPYMMKELSKGRVDKQEWGEFHFGRKDPEDEVITVKLRKEKEDGGPSRYKVKTNIPAFNFQDQDGKTDFLFSYDRDRRLWMGFEVKIRKDFWKPELPFLGE